MNLHDFTTRYLSVVHDFTEMLPLLVESEHTAAHLHTLGGRLYGASSQWLKIALQYAAEDAEVTDSMIQALNRAETILQHLRMTSLHQQSPESLRFSDLQFGQAVRDLTHEEFEDLLNVLGHGDLGPSTRQTSHTPALSGRIFQATLNNHQGFNVCAPG